MFLSCSLGQCTCPALLGKEGSLSSFISSARKSRVKCLAMQEGGLGEPPPPSQGPGVDLRGRGLCEAGRGREGARASQRVRLTGAILEGEAVDHLCSGRERYSREKVGASEAPTLTPG